MPMTHSLFRGMKPFSQLMFTAFVVLGSFVVIQAVTGLAAIFIFGFEEVASLMTSPDFTNPEIVRMMKLFQVAQTAGLFIIPPFIVARLFSENTASYLSLNHKIGLQQVLMVTFLVMAINPFINYLGSLNAEMHLPGWMSGVEDWMRQAEDAAERLTRAFLKVSNVSGLLFNLVMIAILPAFGEELLFRGVFQKQLTRMTGNIHWGIWLSATLFSALHMQFYGFIPRLALGGMFGYLLVWSGSLWLPILAHFINNAGAVIIMWMIDTGKINPSIEEFGTAEGHWPFASLSFFLALVAFWAVRRLAQQATDKESA